MKRYLFIFGMAAMLFAACSSDDELARQEMIPAEDEDEIAIEDLYSDVPITFGVISGEASTRGTVHSQQFKADDIGIFMLSRRNLTTSWGTKWYYDPSSTYTFINRKLNIWQENVSADVRYDVDRDYSYVVWNDNDEEHYYPKVQRYAYEFIAYYPRTPMENIVYSTFDTSGQRIAAVIDLDGSQDVMYAHPVTPANNIAWTSEYFKQNTTADPPHFNFEHKLARLTFKLKLEGDFANVGTYYVDSLYLEAVPSRVRLFLAQRSSPGGTISGGNIYLLDPNTVQNVFQLRELNGDFVADHYLNYQVTTTGTEVGDAIMVPPMTKTSPYAKLALRVVLRDASGSRYRPTNAIALTPPTDAGWESGKSYPIVITLSDPVKVEAKASVLDYIDYGSDLPFSDANQ